MDPQPSKSGRLNNSPKKRQDSNSGSSSITTQNSLSSILNNPHLPSDPSWSSWFSSTTPELPSNKPPLGSDISKPDFLNYFSSFSDQYARFSHINEHSLKESLDLLLHDDGDDKNGGGGGGGLGDALVACLREVPALYFKEDFELEDGATFRGACPFSGVSENLLLQDKLSHYLDVVELHLVREISLRSDSFFEAQGQLEELSLRIVEGCGRIRELKETIRLLDSDLVDTARQVQDLSVTRGNLLVLQHKLRLILNVNQALAALKLAICEMEAFFKVLIELELSHGSEALHLQRIDAAVIHLTFSVREQFSSYVGTIYCAGALDITDDLQQLLDGDELTGLHCFRHLWDHVAGAIDSVNSILSAEFMRASIHDAHNTDAMILSKSKARSALLTNGKNEDIKLDEEETANFRDQLLPLIVGLLRTAKLPAVLRMYRDTLTLDMKSAIKMAVAELLPVLVAGPLDSDFSQVERPVDADGGGSSLASKLRTLSSESFVQLLRSIFRIVWAHLVRAAEVKKAIEWIMCNLGGHYAADSVASAIAVGAVAAEAAQETDGQVSSFPPHSQLKSASKVFSLQARGNDATSPSNMSRNFRADILRENAEAVFAACDAAHGRWAKLLGVRAVLHPKLRLQEFLSIYNITQEFITATEKIGGRLGYSIRGTIQSQAKAFVDFQHESRMTKIRAVLDQETWVEVDVPDEFHAIVSSMCFVEPMSTGEFDDAPASAPLNGPADNNNNNISDQAIAHRNLSFRGVEYHMANCGLILLKMLSEYIDMNDSLPALSSEIVHRVVELLKFFNTRSCQLVLGAGAMQVSGLKSITSKHLALASQVISFMHSIIPEIRRILFSKVPETRKLLLLSEMDRVAQDYKAHRDEIHTKLVQIMRERVLHHLRGLSQIVESWNRTEDAEIQPSVFSRSVTKEAGFLLRILSRTLHEVDVQAIFRQVVVIFHSLISEAYSRLEINTPQANNRLCSDIKHILGCIRALPTDIPVNNGVPNWGQLDEFFEQRFGAQAGQ